MFSNIRNFVMEAEQQLINQIQLFRNAGDPKIWSEQALDVNDPVFFEKPKDVEKKLKLPKEGNNVIYVFRLIGQLKTHDDFKNLVCDIRNAKVSGLVEGHTQVTTVRKAFDVENPRVDFSNLILYIGTSQEISTRLRQHVGYGNKGISTILLRKWNSLQGGNKLCLTLDVANFGKGPFSESLKMTEYLMSQKFSPLIGHNRRT